MLDEMTHWKDLRADPAFSTCVKLLDKADTAAPPDAMNRRCHYCALVPVLRGAEGAS